MLESENSEPEDFIPAVPAATCEPPEKLHGDFLGESYVLSVCTVCAKAVEDRVGDEAGESSRLHFFVLDPFYEVDGTADDLANRLIH